MAAIDLERGLEQDGRGWGAERLELMDNFDSEMQEWEDQLQDIQRKIEELYNEVQARRGANYVTNDNQRNAIEVECSRGRHGNSPQSKNLSGTIAVPRHNSSVCSYSANGYNCSVDHQNGYCHANGVSEIGDLLQDYLVHGKQMSQKNNGARHVRFSDTINVSPDIPTYSDEIRGNERLGQDQFVGSGEESENWKNQMSHIRGYKHRESSPNKENKMTKPPLGRRDAAAVQPHSQLSQSPALDRKSFSPTIVGDRKCCSPSVLRKFGAMLKENEGKMLTESGVVTHQGLAPEPKCLTPSCQRRALGMSSVTNRASMRVSNQKSQADAAVLTAEVELSQDWAPVSDSGTQNQKDQRGGYSGPKVPQQSPRQSRRRSQVAGSPKLKPRADRDGGLPQEERAWRHSPQHVEPKMDYRMSSVSSGAQRGLGGQDCGHIRDEGLIELLDMLEKYNSRARPGHTAYRDVPQQVKPLSPPTPHRSFSRPARPPNQRPPSRWASHTSTARITSPMGPMYRPPSPLARSPSPMIRTQSPALKHRPLLSYSPQTETVIM